MARRQAAKYKKTQLQAAKTKEEAARHAREAEAAKCGKQAASSGRRKAKGAGETAAVDAAKRMERDSEAKAK